MLNGTRPPSATLLTGDVLHRLAELPDGCVQCVVTSPPYFGLREYGTGTWQGGDPACDHVTGEIRTGLVLAELGARYRGGGVKQGQVTKLQARGTCPKCGAVRVDQQIGLEPTPDAYVARLVEAFREVRRVLHDNGTLWLVMGDTYNNFRVEMGPGQAVHGRDALHGKPPVKSRRRGWEGMKEKDLIGIPWLLAFALRDDGWYLRNDVIFAKPNPMPESIRDRPTRAHEYVFLFSKQPHYFYDGEAVRETGESDIAGHQLRDVWWIANEPLRLKHFAAFPTRLAARCIAAGSSEAGCCPRCGTPWRRIVEKGPPDTAHRRACGADAGGGYAGQAVKDYAGARAQDASATKARILAGMTLRRTAGWQPGCGCDAGAPLPCLVLDPFSGAGTTLLAATRLGRDAIGIDLKAEYAATAAARLRDPTAKCLDTHGQRLPFRPAEIHVP